MAQSDKVLEKQLMEAGNMLLSPPTSVSELLALLDRVEQFLTRVEQSPSESMNKALSPSIKAIVADDLLKHSNVDVKVAVASCISEITRITAPDAPYDDDQMKDVFHLIVSSFEKIDDQSSPSYIKRTNILETVAKVRSCVVMLDLECDGLILEMFQHFFRSIRDDHPENVFSSMETIMTLVLEESEDVPLDLVSSILDFLKTENKEALPIARQLAEKVVGNCASKLKPYLLPAVKFRGASLNDYSKVVANACQVAPEAAEPSDGDAAGKKLADESDFGSAHREKADEVAMETLDDAPPSEEIGATMAASPKSVVSNGTIQKEIEDTSPGIDSTRVADHDNCDGVQTDPEPSKASVESLNAGKNTKSKSRPVKSKKRRGRRTGALKRASKPKPSVSTVNDGNKEIDKLSEQQEASKEVDCTHSEDVVADDSGTARNGEELEAPVSLEKPPETENDNVDATLPLSMGSPADVSLSKEDIEGKKEDEVVQERVPVSDMDFEMESDSKKASEGTDVSEHKPQELPGKKNEEVVQESAPASENDSHKVSDLEKASDGTNVSEPKSHELPGKKKEEVVQESAPASENDSHKESDLEKTSEGTDVSEPKPQDLPGKKKEEVVQESAPASENDSHKESDLTKAFEGANNLETKPHKRTGKKPSSEPEKEERVHSPGDASVKKDEVTGNLVAKSVKNPGKKVEVASSQGENSKKRGQGKGTPSTVRAKTTSVDEEKMPLPKSTEKSSKEVSGVEKVSKTSSKRKRSSGKEKFPVGIKIHGKELVGSRIKVWWPNDKIYYYGFVDSFSSIKKKHKIAYDDGDVEVLKLWREKWKLVDGDHPDQESSEDENPVQAPETPKAKKVKTGENLRTKRGKVATTAKKGASSSKSKATPKSGGKQKDDESSKMDDTPKEESLKSIMKSNKNKGKSKAGSSKSVTKSDQKKAGTKSPDEEAPKPTTEENSDSNTKTDAGETGKPKTEEAEEGQKSPEADEAPESAAKGKSAASASKTQKKQGKKRKRGGRN